jgi:hypothetical protein
MNGLHVRRHVINGCCMLHSDAGVPDYHRFQTRVRRRFRCVRPSPGCDEPRTVPFAPGWHGSMRKQLAAKRLSLAALTLACGIAMATTERDPVTTSGDV